MTTPSVETDPPPAQEDARCIGQWVHGPHTLRLVEVGEVLHLRRHRMHAHPEYSIAAIVTHAGGVVSRIDWDPWHRDNATYAWREDVGHWVRAMVARDWAA